MRILNQIPYVSGNAIVFATDWKYFDFAVVAIQSLLNHLNHNVCIHVFTDVQDSKAMEEQFHESLDILKQASVSVYCIDDLIDLDSLKLKDSGYISKATYYRLIIPEVMQSYDRVLYLDSDICVTHSLDELFEISFENEEIIAGCNEPHFMWLMAKQNRSIALESTEAPKDVSERLVKKYGTISNWYKEEMKIDVAKCSTYMNGGVCLFDIQKCRQFDFVNKAFNFIMDQYNRNGWIHYSDQGVINSICQGRIKWLPSKWNALWTLAFAYYVEFLCRCRKRLKEGREYKESIKDAYIWHYVSAVKPWNKPHKAYDMAMHWWRVCAQTKFFEKHLHMLSPTVQRGILNRLDAEQNTATINDFIDATDA